VKIDDWDGVYEMYKNTKNLEKPEKQHKHWLACMNKTINHQNKRKNKNSCCRFAGRCTVSAFRKSPKSKLAQTFLLACTHFWQCTFTDFYEKST
jgi:hypothetical protein